jgi:hypothetical protein
MSDNPIPEAVRDARQIIDEFIQCAEVGRPHGKLIAQARDWLALTAAQQPAAIPRLANCGKYTATDNNGQHYYLNHANTWQTFQGEQPAAVGGAMVRVPRGAAEVAAAVAVEWAEMLAGIPGLEKYERYHYGPAVEQMRDDMVAALATQHQEPTT